MTTDGAQDDHDNDGVEKLAPSLHEEGGRDFATTVEAIFSS